MLIKLLQEVGDWNFKYKEWDCFTLVNYIKKFNNLREFPKFDHIYDQYNEYNFPKTLLSQLLSENCIQVESFNIQNFDICCVEFSMKENLATYYDNRLIFMGDRGVVSTQFYSLSSRIKSIWRYE